MSTPEWWETTKERPGKAFPTGITSPDTPHGTHYRLEPTWFKDGGGEYVLESTVGNETRIFVSNERAERPDGLITATVDMGLDYWGYLKQPA